VLGWWQELPRSGVGLLMMAKVAAFALLVLIAMAPRLTLPRYRSLGRQASILRSGSFLPQSVGSFRLVRHYRTPASGAVETGGIYADANQEEVTVDLFLDAVATHNAIGCIIGRGLTPVWQRVTSVRAADGPATFDLALFEFNGNLSLTASTQCYAATCEERAIPRLGWDLPSLELRDLLRSQSKPVPLTIFLEEPRQGRLEGERRLLRRFERFVSALDLRPLHQVAADYSSLP